MAEARDQIIVLTGAGASAALGLPTTASFLQRVPQDLQPLRNIIGGMRGNVPPDLPLQLELEEIYSRIQLYEEVGESGSRGDRNLRQLIDKVRLPRGGFAEPLVKPFDELAHEARVARQQLEILILQHCGEVDKRKVEAAYLPLITDLRMRTSSPLQWFTTNYDSTFESLGQALGYERVVTGLRAEGLSWVWRPAHYSNCPEKAVLVAYRLHGCSHWFREPNGEILYQPHPPLGQSQLPPMVIFPSSRKDRLSSSRPVCIRLPSVS